MLSAQGIRASYGRIPILHGIDLEVAEGEFVGILGHNGMGKTTLLKTLIGLVKTTDGTITFEGEAITREPPHKRNRRGIGYVPQGREDLSQRDRARQSQAGIRGAEGGRAGDPRRGARGVPPAQAPARPRGPRPLRRRAADPGAGPPASAAARA